MMTKSHRSKCENHRVWGFFCTVQPKPPASKSLSIKP